MLLCGGAWWREALREARPGSALSGPGDRKVSGVVGSDGAGIPDGLAHAVRVRGEVVVEHLRDPARGEVIRSRVRPGFARMEDLGGNAGDRRRDRDAEDRID